MIFLQSADRNEKRNFEKTYVVLHYDSNFVQSTRVVKTTSVRLMGWNIFHIGSINSKFAVASCSAVSEQDMFTCAHVVMQSAVTSQVMWVTSDVTFAQSWMKKLKVTGWRSNINLLNVFISFIVEDFALQSKEVHSEKLPLVVRKTTVL